MITGAIVFVAALLIVSITAQHVWPGSGPVGRELARVVGRRAARLPQPRRPPERAAVLERLTPDGPRRAPIRWHVATVRDARADSPTARTLVLDVPEWPGHRAAHPDAQLTAHVLVSNRSATAAIYTTELETHPDGDVDEGQALAEEAAAELRDALGDAEREQAFCDRWIYERLDIIS